MKSVAVVAELDDVDDTVVVFLGVLFFFNNLADEGAHQLHYLTLRRGESASVGLHGQALPDGGQFAHRISSLSYLRLVDLLHLCEGIQFAHSFLLFNQVLNLGLSVFLVDEVFADLVF